ncbi:MAG: 4Fe-4S binding protein [Desulfovibrionaceae bacterium]|nr:4Fe-4S binding protein [Desulfovibrionaceae bacterium]MBF0512861.1 4Fe-4S binding protein [Desulfovibrionaceae bacterium]
MTASSSASPRPPGQAPAGRQDCLPGRYAPWVRILAMAAFIYVVAAYLNARVFHLLADADGQPPVWFSQASEYLVIAVFGVWRVIAERDAYTRRRLVFLVAAVMAFWWATPAYLRLPEPYIGALPGAPLLPQLHTPGTLTFFAALLLALLFGRRVICGWNCPCVGIRETVGFAFRDRTPRSGKAWRWRHLKWPFFSLYAGVAAMILIPGVPGVSTAYRVFLGLVALPYFASLLLSPFIGNRAYCRFLCPYGATFGLLNRIGFFQVRLDRERCADCGQCDRVCDMGIPIREQGRAAGKVVSIEECMGCGRCIASCPAKALSFRDARDVLRARTPRDAGLAR